MNIHVQSSLLGARSDEVILRMSVIALYAAFLSFDLNNRPVSPEITVSLHPGTSVVTTGFSHTVTSRHILMLLKHSGKGCICDFSHMQH